jgi:DNA-binding PadR family transcriptional regulator
VVLDVVYDTPKHGYEIIKEIEERTQGRYAPSPGTIYPALQYLSDLELITTTESEGDRKVYAITEAGRKERDERAEHLQAFWQRFTAPQAPEGARVELEFLGEEMGDLMRTVWSRLRPGVGNADQETIRRIRQAVERCKNEVRSILAGAPSEEPAG